MRWDREFERVSSATRAGNEQIRCWLVRKGKGRNESSISHANPSVQYARSATREDNQGQNVVSASAEDDEKKFVFCTNYMDEYKEDLTVGDLK